MRSFITLWGENILLTGTHQDHAENVKGVCLCTMMEDHARVHVHAKHFVLETLQTHLTTAQKRAAGKLYKEYGCHGWTIQVNGRYSTSNIQECVSRIKWEKVKQI